MRAGACGLIAVLARVASAAPPCQPRAALAGDADAVARVRAELEQLGVATASAPAAATAGSACASIDATVTDDAGGLAVAVQRGAQRDARHVGDAALAAAWIDSWLRDDLEGPAGTLPPSATPSRATPPSAVIAQPSQIADAQLPLPARALDDTNGAAPPHARSRWDDVSLAAAFEQQWTTDGERWTGVSVHACARVGAFCLGGRARYAAQSFAFRDTAAARDDESLLATASYERALGRVTIAPELGIGAGRDAVARVDGCKSDPSQPPMPGCQPPGSAPDALMVGDGMHATSYTPRGEAALRISIPLFDHVWLDGLASVVAAPFGHGDDYALPPGHKPPPPMTTPDQLALPGDAFAAFQIGIGLRVGGP